MHELDKIAEEQKSRLTRIRERLNSLTQEIQQKKSNIVSEMFASVTPTTKEQHIFSPSIFSELQNMLLEEISKGYETIIKEKEKVISQLQKDVESLMSKYSQFDSLLKEQVARVTTLSVEKDRSVIDLLKKTVELENENKQLKQTIEAIQLHKEDNIKFVESHFTLLNSVFTELLRFFRNVFGTISEALNIAKEEINGHPAYKKIVLVYEEIQKIITLINKAKDKIVLPKVNLQKIDLKHILTVVLGKYKQMFETKNVHITQQMIDENVFIVSDYQIILEIIDEILLNAIESFSKPGQNQIIITLTKDDKKVILTIEDTGDGIPEHLFPKVFHLFFTTKLDGQHPGVGLFKVYWLLKMFNAEINIKSIFGKGTEVKIEFIPW